MSNPLQPVIVGGIAVFVVIPLCRALWGWMTTEKPRNIPVPGSADQASAKAFKGFRHCGSKVGQFAHQASAEEFKGPEGQAANLSPETIQKIKAFLVQNERYRAFDLIRTETGCNSEEARAAVGKVQAEVNENKPRLNFGTYVEGFFFGIVIGFLVVLGMFVLECLASLYGLSRNPSGGYHYPADGALQRGSTMALWIFSGAFLPGFCWNSSRKSSGRAPLIAGTVTAVTIASLGSVFLQNAGLLINGLDVKIVCFPLGFLLGFFATVIVESFRGRM